MTRSAQRVVGIVVLLVLGMLSLPLSAYVLDGQGTENWIVPVQLLAMAVLGAAVTIGLPGLAREGASTGRRALTGIWWGLLAAFVGVVVFWFLLNGIRGA
jgi:predicted Abi (CAAX) family protease